MKFGWKELEETIPSGGSIKAYEWNEETEGDMEKISDVVRKPEGRYRHMMVVTAVQHSHSHLLLRGVAEPARAA